MKPKVTSWLTEDAVNEAKNEMILRMVNNLMRNRCMSEQEALDALEITQEEYELARGTC